MRVRVVAELPPLGVSSAQPTAPSMPGGGSGQGEGGVRVRV